MSQALSTPPQPLDPSAPPPRLKLFRPAEAHLVIIIPALNEARTIEDVIRRVPAAIAGVGSTDVIVVDDGSTDRTAALAAEAGAIVVRHATNAGVGAAMRSGLRHAIERGADVVLHLDADGQFAPEDIPRLVRLVLADRADCATASRFSPSSLEPSMSPIKRWGNRQVSRIVNRITGLEIHDATCGMRCYSSNALLSLSLVESFTYTHEVLLHLAYKRKRIVEVPLNVLGERPHGRSRVAANVPAYGYRTLKIVLRFLRDYYPMKFFGVIALALLAAALLLTGIQALQTPAAAAGAGSLTVGAVLCVVCAIASAALGVLGDMLCRHRLHLEEVLLHTRSLVAAGKARSRELTPD